MMARNLKIAPRKVLNLMNQKMPRRNSKNKKLLMNHSANLLKKFSEIKLKKLLLVKELRTPHAS
jgi:hypothetical protein